jgi:hypothetical protein
MPTTTKKGHYKYVQTMEANANVQDQEGEGYDNTSILQHIIPIQTTPATDPTHARDSMVYNMGQEVLSICPLNIYFSLYISCLMWVLIFLQETGNVGTNRSYGPLSGESTFVVAARDSIPSAKIKQTTVTMRRRGRAKSTTMSRGRGRSTGQTQGRGRKRKTSTEDARTSNHIEPILDLNAFSQPDEVVVTQGAPARCCDFECTSYTERCIFDNQLV